VLPSWILRTGPVFVPVRAADVRPAATGLAWVRTPRGQVVLLDDDGKAVHDLRRLERLLVTEMPAPSPVRRFPTGVPAMTKRRLARMDHGVRRRLVRSTRLGFSVGADAVGWLAHHAAGTRPVNPWPDGRPAAFVVTHDVEEGRERRALQLARAEATIGLRGTYFLIPAQWRRGDLPDKLRELGHEVACHGIDHSGREAYATAREFQEAAHRLGLRTPAGYRSPRFACAPTHADKVGEAFQYDSSRPETRQGRRRAGWSGCGTVFPFLERAGLIQLPVTLPADLDLLDEGYAWPQVLVAWRAKWRWIREGRGLGLLCTHVPAPGGPLAPLPFLEELVADEQVWTGTAGELASFLAAGADDPGALRPWAGAVARPKPKPRLERRLPIVEARSS
jgi:hypothetical protein